MSTPVKERQLLKLLVLLLNLVLIYLPLTVLKLLLELLLKLLLYLLVELVAINYSRSFTGVVTARLYLLLQLFKEVVLVENELLLLQREF